MKQTILETLEAIERQRNIKIIYAVESGSRAWGFASPDSDYDVRYIYIRRPEDYLRVDTLRDTIEGPLDETLDFSGWDIRKTLDLLRRSNPSLMEWYQAPIVYLTTPLWQQVAEKIPEYFHVRSNMHHYLSMLHGNWHKNFRPEQTDTTIKKYLYVLRPVLCCRWLEKFGTVPPVLFDTVRRAVLPEELKNTVDNLLEQKKYSDEGQRIPRIPELDDFIQQEIPRLTQVREALPYYVVPQYDEVNELFRHLLKEAWGEMLP